MKTFQLAIALYCCFPLRVAFGEDRPPDVTLTANPVFVANCARCHGKNAEGRHFRGPTLVSDKIAAASSDDLRNVINNGKGHMPKFGGKLTPEEIDTLVLQIEALNKK